MFSVFRYIIVDNIDIITKKLKKKMKKSIVTASILALGITSASAMDIFIGIEGSMATANSKFTVNTGTVTTEDSGSHVKTFPPGSISSEKSMGLGIGIKAGVILAQNHRVSIHASDYSNLEAVGSDLELQTYTLNYDYMFVNDSKATPYLGIHAGMSDSEFLGFSDMSEMYGVQAGIIASITDSLEWEMGMSYSYLTSKPTTGLQNRSIVEDGTTYDFTNANAELEMQDMTRVYTSLNYKF